MTFALSIAKKGVRLGRRAIWVVIGDRLLLMPPEEQSPPPPYLAEQAPPGEADKEKLYTAFMEKYRGQIWNAPDIKDEVIMLEDLIHGKTVKREWTVVMQNGDKVSFAILYVTGDGVGMLRRISLGEKEAGVALMQKELADRRRQNIEWMKYAASQTVFFTVCGSIVATALLYIGYIGVLMYGPQREPLGKADRDRVPAKVVPAPPAAAKVMFGETDELQCFRTWGVEFSGRSILLGRDNARRIALDPATVGLIVTTQEDGKELVITEVQYRQGAGRPWRQLSHFIGQNGKKTTQQRESNEPGPVSWIPPQAGEGFGQGKTSRFGLK